MHERLGIALLLTALAGLSTGIGSAIAYCIKKPKTVYLAFALGFSAGVMIYISFMELLPRGLEGCGKAWGIAVFFLGVFFIGLIDLLMPEAKNPHHYKEPNDITEVKRNEELKRTGLFTALAIGIHNFPEGLAAFGAVLSDVKLGIVIALAVAIHNIPEGISVSMPIFYSTGNKKKAFIYSFLTGLSEPVGAIIGFLILMPFLSEEFLASLLAFIAGIMVYISMDEILPTAHRYGHGHTVIVGLVAGMFVMALSLLML
jgi:ZIP family zinc transporter